MVRVSPTPVPVSDRTYLPAILAVAVVLTGCWSLNDFTFECDTDAVCAQGYECRDGVCVSKDGPAVIDNRRDAGAEHDADTTTTSPPNVSTRHAERIAPEEATLHGEFEDFGAPEATEYGFCLETDIYPTSCRASEEPVDDGRFTMRATGLPPGQEVRYRAYATNEAGTDEGETHQFTPPLAWRTGSAGGLHTCGVTIDDRLYCWGSGEYGQHGLGNNDDHPRPRLVTGDWSSVSTMADHTCAIRHDDSLWCWGSGEYGQLGLDDEDDRNQPVQLIDQNDIERVDAGLGHTCRISGGQLDCWGPDIDEFSLGTHSDWVDVGAGAFHFCGLRADGTLWCWGRNDHGQLGLGGADDEPAAAPMQVGFETDWEELTVGGWHSCAIRADGTLRCWGAGQAGRLGVGDEDDRLLPARVGTASSWSTVAASHWHTCGVREDGSLWCWGGDEDGQLGLGETGSRLTPQRVGDDYDWEDVFPGQFHTCGIRDDDSMWCWGANAVGQLGETTTSRSLEPTPVAPP